MSTKQLVQPATGPAATAFAEKSRGAEIDQPNSERLRCVYLCSAPHSGSTLLALLLGAHAEISTVGEFGATFRPDMRCSCGTPVCQCAFWRAWSAAARAAGVPFEYGDLELNLEPRHGDPVGDLFYYYFPFRTLDQFRDSLFCRQSRLRLRAARAIDRYYRLACILCELEDTRVFFDSTKNPYQIRFLAGHPHVDLKVVALVRDGRGVMNSLITKENKTPREAVATWVWSNRNLSRAVRYLPAERVHWMRLEDFCREPKATLDRLQRFCGVAAIGDLDAADSIDQHVIGNRMRHSFRGGVRNDEAWRKRLSQADLKFFHCKAGRLNWKLGYRD